MSERLIALMIVSSWSLQIPVYYLFYEISFVYLLYRVWPAIIWFARFTYSIEMGGWFQSPDVASRATHIWGAMRAVSLDVMGLSEDNKCPSFWLVHLLCHIWRPVSQASRWLHRVLTGSWARQLFCLRALGMLGLSYRLTIFLIWHQVYYLW